jgi:tetratricopeptide (TPR) repeat protein
MSDQQPKKRRGRAVPPKSSVPASPTNMRRANEQMLQNIGKLLQEREFGSAAEANDYLQQQLASGGIPTAAAVNPLDRAQELMYDAWEATGARRVKLARQALEISPDCADAYVLLAEEARSLPEAKQLFEQGVRAGERALGPQMFEEDVGHFWGMIETRPYMRARAGLASCLWQLGERQVAIDHYVDMLRLNPGDNQGIRYVLANCLLRQGDDAALTKLLAAFKDDAMAEWQYTRALLAFRREGAGKKADAALKRALKQNMFVPAYLLGKKRLPRQLPGYIGFGDENEAVSYVAEALDVWRRTPGAIMWLSSNLSDVDKRAALGWARMHNDRSSPVTTRDLPEQSQPWLQCHRCWQRDRADGRGAGRAGPRLQEQQQAAGARDRSA